jgi:hypothetical protein
MQCKKGSGIKWTSSFEVCGGLHWLDDDEVVVVVKSDALQWRSARHEYGYNLIGVWASDGVSDHWRFHDVVDLIAAYPQPANLNFGMEHNGEKRDANFVRIEEICPARLAAAAEKKQQQIERKRAAQSFKN